MEADLNAGAKVHFVKRMMNTTALEKKQIPPSQYAKKGSKAIEAAIVKVLFFTIFAKPASQVYFLPAILCNALIAWHTQFVL